MKKCHYCDFENKDTAHFCVKCGKDLEKHCPKCNGALSMEEEEIYCPSCGARVDGKLECPKCGAVNEGGNKFCEGWGAPLTCANPSTLRANPYANPSAAGISAPQSAPVKAPKEKKDTRRLLVRILDICRASLILVFSLVMFIMSFMSVSRVSAPEDILSDLDMNGIEIISVDVSSLDLIQGAFLRIDPESEEAIVKNFASYVFENLSKKDQALLDEIIKGGSSSVSDLMRVVDIIADKIEDYNVLKFMSGKETVELTPAVTMQLWVMAAMSFVYIGVSFAFFIAALVDFIYTLTGRKKPKAPFALAGLSFASALALGFTAKMMLEGSLGAGLVAFLVFAILALAVEIGYRIAAGECRLTLAKLPRYISAGVGAALAVVVLCLSCSSLIRVACEYTAVNTSYSTFRGGYNASLLADSWNMIKALEADPSLLGAAETYIPHAFSSWGHGTYGILMEQALAPSAMGVLGNLEGMETVLAILGPVLVVICVAVIVTMALSIADNIKAVGSDRAPGLTCTIVGLCLVGALLALTVAYTVLVNETMSSVKDVSYTAGVSGALITAMVFAVVGLIQNIVCRVLTKKKTAPRPEAPYADGYAPLS